MFYFHKAIKQVHVSRHNAERENKVIFLMITDGEKLHYVAFKS